MKILITGSKGIVGEKLLKELKYRGHNVFGIDLYHDKNECKNIHSLDYKGDYSRCDIGEYRQIADVIEKAGYFDLVYNCAAEFGRWNGENYYEQMWKSNLIGLKNILKLQERYKFKLVHFSSSEVYGDWKDLMTESTMDNEPIKQMNDYAISKWANELQIRNSMTLNNTESVIVRLFNTYGIGEYYTPYRSVNCKICYHALKRIPITIYKGHHRSSTYILDCVKTLANIADNFINGRIYNIGSSQYHSIESITEYVWDLTGADKNLITYQDSEMLTTKNKMVDISLSEKELGHKETINIWEGLKRTILWMRKYYE
jgi:dTDP-glucose 4,6-dehydratase